MAAEPAEQIEKRGWAGRLAYAALFLLLALSGAALMVGVAGAHTYRWKGLAVELRLLPSSEGVTRLLLPPLGEVRAATHRAPVALAVRLDEIQIEEIRDVVRSGPNTNTLAKDFEREARVSLTHFAEKQMFFAAMGALAAPVLLRARRARLWLAAPLIGASSLAAVGLETVHTFNGQAFSAPVYTGALKQAPWVIQFGQDAFVKIEALSQKLQTVAGNLNVLYGRIEAVAAPLTPEDEANAVRVLHISDLHNNPAALRFVREVAAQFRVAFILDTGDLTDFGSPPETALISEIAKFPWPYLFVTGNHDSRAVVAAFDRAKNVIVLDGRTVTQNGITITGAGNPAADRAGAGADAVEVSPEALNRAADALAAQVAALPAPPDIVAVHDPKQSREIWGRVPFVAAGHMHREYLETQNAGNAPLRTILCNAGTTGAAGLRYFEKSGGVPFTCAVLTFRRLSPVPPGSEQGPAPVLARPQLRGVTLIKLDGSLGQYSVTHHTVSERGVDTPSQDALAPPPMATKNTPAPGAGAAGTRGL